jgi:hypothetical protein
MTIVRFQADADLKQAIVTGTLRRQPNIDFQSANAAELEGRKDSEVLAIAAQDARVLVTHDRKTMPYCYWQWYGRTVECKNFKPHTSLYIAPLPSVGY